MKFEYLIEIYTLNTTLLSAGFGGFQIFSLGGGEFHPLSRLDEKLGQTYFFLASKGGHSPIPPPNYATAVDR